MLRVDYVTYDDEGVEQLMAGIGIFMGRLQRVEGDPEFAKIMLEHPMAKDVSPREWLETLQHLYNNQIGFATEPYEDDDTSYDTRGMFIGPDGLPDGMEFAFCPTGPGGGVDNSCGKGEGGGAGHLDTLKAKVSKLKFARDTVVKQIKEAKAAGKPFSALKTQRAKLNKQLADAQNELSDALKGKMVANAPPKLVAGEKAAWAQKIQLKAPPPKAMELPKGAFADDNQEPIPGSGLSRLSASSAEKHYGSWANSLNHGERAAIDDYTGAGYHGINEGLRTGLLNNWVQDKVDKLDSAVAKAPPLTQDILVHRGVSAHNNKVFKEMKAGDVFMERGFCSTSVGKGSAFGGDVKLNIKVPKGTKAMYVSGFGLGVKGEKELLLNRETKFKVVRTYQKQTIKFVDLEIIK